MSASGVANPATFTAADAMQAAYGDRSVTVSMGTIPTT
jgi:hypothetical protein